MMPDPARGRVTLHLEHLQYLIPVVVDHLHDVVVWPDGRVEVLDRDDFEENSVKFGYSNEVIKKAEAALIELLAIVEAGNLP